MKWIVSAALALLPLAAVADAFNVNLVPVDTAYSATSVNAAIFRNNSVVTRDSLHYVAYYDPD